MASLEELMQIAAVRSFLFDGECFGRLQNILLSRQLDVSRAEELLDLTDAVLDDQLPLSHMPALVMQAFGVDEKVATEISVDVAGIRLLPLRDFVPGIAEQITAWGKKPEDYPQKRIGKAKVTTDRLAGELAEKHGLDFSDVLIKRMGFLIKGYFDGSKSRESALTFFSRAPSIGGLGMAAEDAQKVLNDVDAMRKGIELVEREEEVHEVMQEVMAPTTPSPSSGRRGGDADHEDKEVVIAPSHELAVEVPVIAGKAMKQIVDEPVPDAAAQKTAKSVQAAAAPSKDKLEVAVAACVERAAPTLQTKRIAKKAFADVARAAIRGVRDLYQTREMLERDMGFAGAELEALTEAIEEGHAAYNGKGDEDPSASSLMSTTAVGMTKTLGMTKDDNDDVVAKEAEVLNTRFSAKTSKAAAPIESIMPTAQVSAARTKSEELEIQAAKIAPEDRAKAEVAARPAPITAKLTVGSVPPPKSGEQRVVADVRPTNKLMGPVEQLGSMTPTEFRRLSTSPSDAIQKIDDLLLSLERNSYEDRLKGVKAWRQSPVNQLYLGMASQALQNSTAIAEIASRKRASGEESLSPAEIRAIATLNAKLRF